MSKLTLAEAIAAGTDKGYLRVQEGAGGMVLERKVFASRKDGKVAVISKGKERLQKKSKDGASGARSKEMEDGPRQFDKFKQRSQALEDGLYEHEEGAICRKERNGGIIEAYIGPGISVGVM